MFSLYHRHPSPLSFLLYVCVSCVRVCMYSYLCVCASSRLRVRGDPLWLHTRFMSPFRRAEHPTPGEKRYDHCSNKLHVNLRSETTWYWQQYSGQHHYNQNSIPSRTLPYITYDMPSEIPRLYGCRLCTWQSLPYESGLHPGTGFGGNIVDHGLANTETRTQGNWLQGGSSNLAGSKVAWLCERKGRETEGGREGEDEWHTHACTHKHREMEGERRDEWWLKYACAQI